MSDALNDPFEESRWGSLRYPNVAKDLIDRSMKVMVGLAKCFAVESHSSPHLAFEAGGEMPSIGKFTTPLAVADVRLSFRFQTAHEAGEPDDIVSTIQVFVQDAEANSGWRKVNWFVEVPQYGAEIAHCGGQHRNLSDSLGGGRLNMNRYQSGMALYRAIVESK
ncbi:hypothetical protein M5J07_17630 [Achromobacter mucicolens]|uniref:hypothetical protein n=1 Tax=Achromobacter mucicolens TaxID=1389922 RepID=UPI0020A48FE0|nr:hypothetical protein [Achromobacter mucicolens]MCP2516764.1 hypothetical protein [Achromobacter mucicolens]